MSYTPSLDEVRDCYKYSSREVHESPGDAHFAFDRAIAQVRADAKREAWEEGVKAAVDSECYNPPCGSCEACDTILVNPYEVSE